MTHVVGKDVFWYAKDKSDLGVTQQELEAVKAREREMMAEVSSEVLAAALCRICWL